VDFKSDYGFLAYASEIELAQEIDAIKRYIDVDYLIDHATQHNVKIIARIVCFRDNYLSRYDDYGIVDDSGQVWVDNKDIAWTNPYYKKVRKYLLEITREVVQLGINKIAFDYIRFPTDGDVARIRLNYVEGPRYVPIIDFLKTVRDSIDGQFEIGVCVFGFAVWYNLKSEGQDIAKMGEFIDFLYPMLYPSHFGWSFKREESEYWRNYWIYFDSVIKAREKLPSHVKVVPFIQGFDLRSENFNNEYIFAQIDGSISADADGFIVWNARGDYATSWYALGWVYNSVLRQSVQMNLSLRMKEAGQRYQDRALQELLAQPKIQMRNLTMPQLHNQIDSLPLSKIRRFFPDRLIP
jgi:hypothetical protein